MPLAVNVRFTKVAVVFHPADDDLEETVSPGDGRLTYSSKLRGYGRGDHGSAFNQRN
jgi:hypothetical protein